MSNGFQHRFKGVQLLRPMPKIVSERVAVNGDQPALKTGAAGNGTGSTPALSAKIIFKVVIMKKGSVGEIATQLAFLKRGYEVYSPATDNAKYDFLVHKDGLIETVEVKSTSVKRGELWRVQLKRVRSNKNENRIMNFDNSQVDYLAVYIEPLDKVIIYKAKDIKSKTELSLKI